jgi:hypothetical protein
MRTRFHVRIDRADSAGLVRFWCQGTMAAPFGS